jgi:Flp pilus assembly pilin Flp
MNAVVGRFWRDEAGQDMAEYALLLSLIAIVLVVTINAFKGAIQAKFLSATSSLTSGAGT